MVAAIRAAGINKPIINLMAMNYGSPASRSVCVVSGGKFFSCPSFPLFPSYLIIFQKKKLGFCDMGASAIQAAMNVNISFGFPRNQIEITPMLGRNDVNDEVFFSSLLPLLPSSPLFSSLLLSSLIFPSHQPPPPFSDYHLT